MYIKVTQIDSLTNTLCTEAPMRNGPSFPSLPNLQIEFCDESNYPILTTENGTYTTAPLFWGTCDDSADISVIGVIGKLTKKQYDADKLTEAKARKPYDSWIFDNNTFMWNPPVPRPSDGKPYYWDEPSLNWVEFEYTNIMPE